MFDEADGEGVVDCEACEILDLVIVDALEEDDVDLGVQTILERTHDSLPNCWDRVASVATGQLLESLGIECVEADINAIEAGIDQFAEVARQL